jgi:hypothetical protein
MVELIFETQISPSHLVWKKYGYSKLDEEHIDQYNDV